MGVSPPTAIAEGRGDVRTAQGASGQKPPKKKATASPKKELTTTEARLAFIRKAQMWAPTHVSAMDLRAGPQGPGAFQPNASVTCDYVERHLPGTTQKFACAISQGDVVKVRYGDENGKVEGSVLASRLLWALGFDAAQWKKRERTACVPCPCVAVTHSHGSN